MSQPTDTGIQHTVELRIEPMGAIAPEQVADLWRACGLVMPYNPPLADIAFAAGQLHSDILLGILADELVASVMVGHDGHRGWIYYLAVSPRRRGAGFGRRMVQAAEDWLRVRGVRKAQLLVRESNRGVVAFYERIGYEPAPVIVMQRWLENEAT